jgi:hypothetical protein
MKRPNALAINTAGYISFRNPFPVQGKECFQQELSAAAIGRDYHFGTRLLYPANVGTEVITLFRAQILEQKLEVA